MNNNQQPPEFKHDEGGFSKPNNPFANVSRSNKDFWSQKEIIHRQQPDEFVEPIVETEKSWSWSDYQLPRPLGNIVVGYMSLLAMSLAGVILVGIFMFLLPILPAVVACFVIYFGLKYIDGLLGI